MHKTKAKFSSKHVNILQWTLPQSREM